MPERASIFQVVQIGVETTPGTAVPANKRLQSLMLELSPKTEIEEYKPSGGKYATVTALGKEWSEGKLSGVATYSEFIYVLGIVYPFTAPTQIGTTGAYTWQYNPQSYSSDNAKTYTVERGGTDGTGAERSVQLTAMGWNYKFDRSKVEVEAEMFGRALETGVTLTASPTAIELRPILGKQVSVYLDTSIANIGTTKLTRVLSGEFSHSDARAPLWAVDAAQGSYVAVVESDPKLEFKLELEADAVGMALFNTMRAGDTRFARVEAIGANIGAAADYTFQHDLALQVKDVSSMGDKDGVFAVTFTFSLIHNDSWGTGKAHSLKLINKQQTL